MLRENLLFRCPEFIGPVTTCPGFSRTFFFQYSAPLYFPCVSSQALGFANRCPCGRGGGVTAGQHSSGVHAPSPHPGRRSHQAGVKTHVLCSFSTCFVWATAETSWLLCFMSRLGPRACLSSSPPCPPPPFLTGSAAFTSGPDLERKSDSLEVPLLSEDTVHI